MSEEEIISRACNQLGEPENVLFTEFLKEITLKKLGNITFKEWLGKKQDIKIESLCKQIGEPRQTLETCFRKESVMGMENITFYEWLKRAVDKRYNPVQLLGSETEEKRGR